MKKRIGKRTYDTGTASRIGSFEEGKKDAPDYICETLYRMKNRALFLFVAGGPDTKYGAWKDGRRVYSETIVPMSEEDARVWTKEHLSEEERRAFLETGGRSNVARTFVLPDSLDKRLDGYCKSRGIQKSYVAAAAISEYLDRREQE